MLRLVITFIRTVHRSNPYALPADEQAYMVQISKNRRVPGPVREASLDWKSISNILDDLRSANRSSGTHQRMGDQLQAFLYCAGWQQYESDIRKTLDNEQPVHITLVSNAAELYGLPWELLSFGHPRIHLGAHEHVVIGHAWPVDQAGDNLDISGSDTRRPTRVLMLWSAAGGSVPKSTHIDALIRACTRADSIAFKPERDVIGSATITRLRSALDEIDAGERVALHILCHGMRRGDNFGLAWNKEDGTSAFISPSALGHALVPHINKLCMVTLCACNSTSPSERGCHLGSTAQELHRIGVPWVIGTCYPLTKRASATFAERFYRSFLGKGSSVERAFVHARGQLFNELGGSDWNSLQLYADDEYRGVQSTDASEVNETLHTETPQDFVKKIREELIATTSMSPESENKLEIREFELEQFVAKQPGNPEARQLLRQVKEARKYLRDKLHSIWVILILRPPKGSPKDRNFLVRVIGVLIAVIAAVLFWDTIKHFGKRRGRASIVLVASLLLGVRFLGRTALFPVFWVVWLSLLLIFAFNLFGGRTESRLQAAPDRKRLTDARKLYLDAIDGMPGQCDEHTQLKRLPVAKEPYLTVINGERGKQAGGRHDK